MTHGDTVVVTRILQASPDIVFDEWLDPEALKDWMCPRPARATSVVVEPRVGGRLRIDILENDSSFYVEGEFRTLQRPRLLVFTWTCSNWPKPTESLVSVTLEPMEADRTYMTIEHQRLHPDHIDNHQRGWEQISVQLDATLATRSRESTRRPAPRPVARERG